MIQGFIVLIALLLVGDILSNQLGIPVPGSVIGMIILFFWLVFSKKLHDGLEKTSDGLIAHIGLLFVPVGAGVSVYLFMIADNWLAILLTSFASTALTLIFTAIVFNALKKKSKKEDDSHD